MRVVNFLQLNDLKIRTFLIILVAFQLALWGSVGLDFIGLDLRMLREIVSLIYLLFIPGALTLRVLKIHDQGLINTLLYITGLSIANIMFAGFFINLTFPIFGVNNPISVIPLVISVSVEVLLLTLICYIVDKGYSTQHFIYLKGIFSPSFLILLLIILLTIFGTYAVNAYKVNFLLLFVFAIISLFVFFSTYESFLPTKFYPFSIFALSISLVLHNSLISNYIWGWDIFHEQYIANLVIKGSFWDSTIRYSTNSMLSIVMFEPILSIISGINIVWIFKVINPLIFSLVPLGLYRIFQIQTNDKIAYISCIFFMSVVTFYSEMLTLIRQQLAELFLVILILTLIEEIDTFKKSILLVIFLNCLVVSHYGLSYIFLFYLVIGWTILFLFTSRKFKIVNFQLNKPSSFSFKEQFTLFNVKDKPISSNYVLLAVIFTFGWYMYTSTSFTFDNFIRIVFHILSSIGSSLLDSNYVEGLAVLKTESNPGLIHDINKLILYLNQIFIIMGVAVVSISYNFNLKFRDSFFVFSFISLVILFLSLIIPFFSSALNMTRMYHITLIFLSPFFVIGALTSVNYLLRAFNVPNIKNSFRILSIYLVVFLLFQTGFIFNLIEGKSGSISLDISADKQRFNEQEILGANWLYNERGNNEIYADTFRQILLSSFNWGTVTNLPPQVNYTVKNSYIYFGTYNLITGKVLVQSKIGVNNFREYIDFSNLVSNKNNIYNNGGVEIYFN